MTIVGTAEVPVVPLTSGFAPLLKRGVDPALKSAEADAAKAGEATGAGLAAGVKKGTDAVGKELSSAKLSSGLSKGMRDATLGVLGFATASVVAAGKFQSANAQIAASAGIPIAAAEKIGKAFLSTTGHSIFSANTISASYGKVAGVLGAVEGHALGASEALKFMGTASDLAEASGLPLEQVTTNLTKVMQAYKLNLDQASHASDILFNASRVTGVEQGQLVQAITRTKAKLGELAPSLAETGGLLDALAKNGVTGRVAISSLSGGFNTMIGKSKETQAAAKALGLEIFNSNGHFVGMKSVIEQLHPKLSGLTEQQQLAATKAIFGAGANRQLLSVIQAGPQAYQRETESVSKSGSVKDAAAKQSKTLSREVDLLKATAVDLAIKFGNLLIPVLTKLAHTLSDGVEWLSKHKAAAVALAGVITTILGAAVAGYVYTKGDAFVKTTKGMITAMGQLASKMTATAATVEAEEGAMATATEETAVTMDGALLATGIGAAVVALGIAAFELKEHWDEVMEGLEEATAAAANFIIGILNTIVEGFNETIGEITGDIGTIGEVSTGNQSKSEEQEVMPELEAEAKKRHISVKQLQHEFEMEGTPQGNAIGAAARKYHVPETALVGIYGTETSYGKNINTSSTGAQGAFQFEPETAKQYHYPLTNHPNAKQFKEQAEAAAHYIHDLIKQHGSLDAALAIYSGHTAGYAQKVKENAKSIPGLEEALGGGGKHHAAHHHAASSGPSTASIVKWAEQHVGKFAESTGKNTGPELDKLQAEFHTRAAAWCAEFATTAALMGGANKAVRTASVATIKLWAEQGSHGYHKGLSRTPQAGDIATFGSEHAGFVQSVNKSAGTYVDIEGNTGAGKVSRVTRKLSEGEFARPAYKKVEAGGVELQRASKGFEVAAQMDLKKQTADKQHGEAEAQKLRTAIESGSAKELTKVVGGSHERGFKQLIHTLHGDHFSGMQKMVKDLVKTHKEALEALTRALLKENEEASARGMDKEDRLHSEQATYAAQHIADVTKVSLDQQAERGKSGADLVVAQAETNLDIIKENNDTAISAARQAMVSAEGVGILAEAAAKKALQDAEDQARVTEAQAQAQVELASAAAKRAEEETKAAEEKKRKAEEEAAKQQPAAGGKGGATFNIVIDGTNLNEAELVQELGWSIKTGLLPTVA